jgi:hypothetical protein
VKDQQTVQQFIELRSKGLSFARIAQQCHRAIQNQPLMGGSKPATLRWDNSYHFSKSVQG